MKVISLAVRILTLQHLTEGLLQKKALKKPSVSYQTVTRMRKKLEFCPSHPNPGCPSKLSEVDKGKKFSKHVRAKRRVWHRESHELKSPYASNCTLRTSTSPRDARQGNQAITEPMASKNYSILPKTKSAGMSNIPKNIWPDKTEVNIMGPYDRQWAWKKSNSAIVQYWTTTYNEQPSIAVLI